MNDTELMDVLESLEYGCKLVPDDGGWSMFVYALDRDNPRMYHGSTKRGCIEDYMLKAHGRSKYLRAAMPTLPDRGEKC